jgi:hypothetical protein
LFSGILVTFSPITEDAMIGLDCMLFNHSTNDSSMTLHCAKHFASG